MRLTASVQYFMAALIAFISSTGFWAYLQRKNLRKTATTRLLLGLAYDKIITLGMKYIERGWISKDEYEDFRKYLYEPYSEFGGNGVAERIMNEVQRLPLRSNSPIEAVIDEKNKQREI